MLIVMLLYSTLLISGAAFCAPRVINVDQLALERACELGSFSAGHGAWAAAME